MKFTTAAWACLALALIPALAVFTAKRSEVAKWGKVVKMANLKVE